MQLVFGLGDFGRIFPAAGLPLKRSYRQLVQIPCCRKALIQLLTGIPGQVFPFRTKTGHSGHNIAAAVRYAVNIADDGQKSGCLIRLLRCKRAACKELRNIGDHACLHSLVILIPLRKAFFLFLQCGRICSLLHSAQNRVVHAVQQRLCAVDAAPDFSGNQQKRSLRLRHHAKIQKHRTSVQLRLPAGCSAVRHNAADNFHHHCNQRQPHNGADYVEGRMCIRDLPGNHLDLRSLR